MADTPTSTSPAEPATKKRPAPKATAPKSEPSSAPRSKSSGPPWEHTDPSYPKVHEPGPAFGS